MPEHQLCTAPIIGGDGNVYAVVGTCCDALRKCGYRTEADELKKRVIMDNEAHSYDEALVICMQYCEPVGAMERPRKCDELDEPEPEDDIEEEFDDEEDEDLDEEEDDDLEDELDDEDDADDADASGYVPRADLGREDFHAD